MSNSSDSILGWVILGIFAALVWMGYIAISDDPVVPDELDASGYVSHKVETTITAESGWLVGESKSCLTIPLDRQMASTLGKKPGYAFFYVKCDEGPERKISVTFWGRKNQGGRVAYWQCKRTAESFVCGQTGAEL